MTIDQFVQITSQLKETKFAREGLTLDKYVTCGGCGFSADVHSDFIRCLQRTNCEHGTGQNMLSWLRNEEL